MSSASAVEHGLFYLFYVCSDKLNEEQATKIYSEIGWMKTRIALFDYAVRMKGSSNEIDNWEKIKKILMENKSIRDFASHYHVDFDFDQQKNIDIMSLRRPEYSSSGKKADVVITEEGLENACRELDKTQSLIGDLIELMADRIYG